MKLSFVIPAYNEEAYLGRCLESIFKNLKGNGYDAEVIVVNNASTDGTRKVAESFKDVIIVDEPRKGLSGARQAGFMASHGELIANLDADTVLPAGWIDRVLAEFSKHKKLAALSGPFSYYDLSKSVNFWIKVFFSLGSATNFVYQHVLHIGGVLQGGNFILRRSALEKIGGYDVELTFHGEDTDVAQRISKVGKVKFTSHLPMPTSARRLKGEGILLTCSKATLKNLWIVPWGKPFKKMKAKDFR